MSVESYSMYYRTNKNMLRYLLRSVAKNLSFINKVWLVVQNESEVPSYVNKKEVNVVTHKEFIPAKYLPTFNSNTIESFIGRIDGLADRFLYMNDDWFIIDPLTEEDFFARDKALSYFYLDNIENEKPTSFQEYLLRNSELIWGISREDSIKKGKVINMNHTIRPYFKKAFNECYEKY